jgi:aminodeoxyfutalosine synthase
LGTKLAQVALGFGADDLHGTIGEEKIFHMAGAATPQVLPEAAMIQAIREAGQIPVQRDTFYERIVLDKTARKSPESSKGNSPSYESG